MLSGNSVGRADDPANAAGLHLSTEQQGAERPGFSGPASLVRWPVGPPPARLPVREL